MKFRVTIRKEGAADEIRVVEAASRFAVYEEVEKEGGSVAAMTEASAGFKMPAWLNMTIGSGVKQQEIISMTKNLSAMLAAGLSLSRGLSVIERQTPGARLKVIAQGIGESIKKGASFHEALAKYDNVFSGLFIAMARAGEESGGLASALSVVGLQMERTQALIRKIRGAMIYPAIVVTAIFIVGILMLIFVVPTLTSTFTELHVDLPVATQVIVAISDFMVGHIILVVLGIILWVGLGIAFFRSRIGKAAALWSSLHLPVVGELVRETYAARAARTLSSLLSSGVPVLEALSITEEVVGKNSFGRVIAETGVRVKKGELLSALFADYPKLYPILMSDMIAVGEETGNLAGMLKQVAEFYEEDVSEKTKDLSTIIEPVLMLFIGAVVGVFAVSMIAPIYSLSSAI